MPSAAYTTAASAYNKQVQWLVEIDLPRCTLSYFAGDCTVAADLGDGSRCHYTYSTCQKPSVFDLGSRTYRFCLRDVPWPDIATVAYPLLKRMVSIPQRVNPKKLSVFPEEITIDMMLDHLPPAQDVDKALHNTSKTGEFWKNLKARHPNYAGKDVRILRGFNASGFVLSDFEQVGPTYTLKAIQVDKDGVMIRAESPLKRLDERTLPWTISDDNLTTETTAASGAITLKVTDGGEFPDPADYTRNEIYVEVDPGETEGAGYNEIMEVASISGNNMTIDAAGRGAFNTTERAHTFPVKVRHVAPFGQTTGGVEYSPVNSMDTIQDLLEWAGVASGKVSSATFANVKAAAWPDNDVRRIIRKSTKISKLIQQIREPRGVILFVDSAGTFSVAVMAPNDAATVIDDDSIVQDTLSVTEDTEDRITRVSLWYDPTKDNARDPDDFNSAVIIINAELEGANVFGDKQDEQILDFWVYSSLFGLIRSLPRRLIARRAYGTRSVQFDLEVKDAAYNVGDAITLKTRHITDPLGNIVARPILLTSRIEAQRSTVTYEGVDTNYSGRFLRIGPDTMAATYDTATNEDKAFGYWGDTDNRVGALKEEGYRFW